MHRALILVVFLAAIGGVVLITGSDASAGPGYDETVPDDLRALADETWNDFLAAHPGRWECISPPNLRADWDLESRGEYRPGSATVVVRVPGTPATLRSELIHEFAHHVEFSCVEHHELRPDFLRAQGFAPTATWDEGDSWENTPAEQYAEATVELIEGRRTHPGGIQITPEAIDVIREWGDGS